MSSLAAQLRQLHGILEGTAAAYYEAAQGIGMMQLLG